MIYLLHNCNNFSNEIMELLTGQANSTIYFRFTYKIVQNTQIGSFIKSLSDQFSNSNFNIS